jgi:hypothetical protein
LKSPITLTLVAFGEIHAVDAVDRAGLCAQFLVRSPMPAFVEQVQIVVGQQVRKRVRIVQHDFLASPIDALDQVPG